MAGKEHEVRVSPLPGWVELHHLLGPTKESDLYGEGWQMTPADQPNPPWRGGLFEARARLTSDRAADLAARLRGLGLEGRAICCEIDPPLRRSQIRRARSEDARRRRDTTPGFLRAGVRLDREGRWSLTPEALARRVARWAEGRPVVDAGCGVGGNAIAFAREGCPVIAIERDAERLAMARHNAKIYGVDKLIHFEQGDAIELAGVRGARNWILFVDPPWGPDWSRERTQLADLPLLAALAPIAAAHHGALWAKLPPSFVLDELLGPEDCARAIFGQASGDRRRIKFVLAMSPSS